MCIPVALKALGDHVNDLYWGLIHCISNNQGRLSRTNTSRCSVQTAMVTYELKFARAHHICEDNVSFSTLVNVGFGVWHRTWRKVHWHHPSCLSALNHISMCVWGGATYRKSKCFRWFSYYVNQIMIDCHSLHLGLFMRSVLLLGLDLFPCQ